MARLELFSASRKSARAMASIIKGSGRVRVNNLPAEVITPELARRIILTPIDIAGEMRNKVDINVRVEGGGVVGRALASAMAISRALTAYRREYRDHPLTKSQREEIRTKLLQYDKHLLTGDPRRTEPKKFGGRGARSRKQKSYR
ncbi:MAG: 30S ribosomal protein S9 [Nitrososphaerales archaeon]